MHATAVKYKQRTMPRWIVEDNSGEGSGDKVIVEGGLTGTGCISPSHVHERSEEVTKLRWVGCFSAPQVIIGIAGALRNGFSTVLHRRRVF